MYIPHHINIFGCQSRLWTLVQIGHLKKIHFLKTMLRVLNYLYYFNEG